MRNLRNPRPTMECSVLSAGDCATQHQRSQSHYRPQELTTIQSRAMYKYVFQPVGVLGHLLQNRPLSISKGATFILRASKGANAQLGRSINGNLFVRLSARSLDIAVRRYCPISSGATEILHSNCTNRALPARFFYKEPRPPRVKTGQYPQLK
jgi:hypothetical protein